MSVVISVAILLAVVYVQMSNARLNKNENSLETTAGRTVQEAKVWMHSTLTMPEAQWDTIVPGPDFDATSRIRHQGGPKSDVFLLGDVYFDEDSHSGVLKFRSAG